MRKKQRQRVRENRPALSASDVPLTPAQAVVLLRYECDILLSRVSAILDCPEAVESLAAQDVFGDLIEPMLREDRENLQAVLEKTKHLVAADTVTGGELEISRKQTDEVNE